MTSPVQQIEQLLHIQLEKYDYKKEHQVHTYTLWTQLEGIKELKLEGITINSIKALLPFTKSVHTLKLINCTIGNIRGLFDFENLCNLTLDNVDVQDIKEIDPSNNCSNDYQGFLMEINLDNMEIKNLGILQPMAGELTNIYITNCTVHNFYEVNLFPKLYDLRLDNVVIKRSIEDKMYKPDSERNFTWLFLTSMEIEDINYFVPISKGLHGIICANCSIGSIRELTEFTNLQEFEIDAATVIRDVELVKDSVSSFTLKECVIATNEDDNDGGIIDFDIKKLAPIANLITAITFRIDTISNLTYLKNFDALKALKFDRVTARLNDFLCIAEQINTLDFVESKIKNRKKIGCFKNLEILKIDANTPEESFKNFKTVLPLKHQLKKFDFWEFSDSCIKNLTLIEQFTALESVLVLYASKKVTKSLFSLSNLKKLSIHIRAKHTETFDVASLKNIKELYVENKNPIALEGFSTLKHLEVLSLKDSCKANDIYNFKNLWYLKINEAVDINKLPAIPTLTKLEIDVTETYEVSELTKFTNLKELSIKGTNKINLGHLPNLKVLDISSTFPKKIDFLEGLPNLEKLSLENNGLTEITGLERLSNLKMLNLSENYEIEDLTGVTNLKSLEYLNLYENKISDVSLLNLLPSLKQVNLGGNIIEKPEAYHQLNTPKIAVFYGLPHVPFWIWKDQDFEL